MTEQSSKKGLKGCLFVGLGLVVIFFIFVIFNIVQQATMSPEEIAKEKTKDSLLVVAEKRKENEVNAEKLAKIAADSLEKANSGKTMAKIMCEYFVKKTLKSPSTAEFCSNNEYQYNNIATGLWALKGYVDSQNSFGAMIRTSFQITLKFNGVGSETDVNSWEVVVFDVNP